MTGTTRVFDANFPVDNGLAKDFQLQLRDTNGALAGTTVGNDASTETITLGRVSLAGAASPNWMLHWEDSLVNGSCLSE